MAIEYRNGLVTDIVYEDRNFGGTGAEKLSPPELPWALAKSACSPKVLAIGPEPAKSALRCGGITQDAPSHGLMERTNGNRNTTIASADSTVGRQSH